MPKVKFTGSKVSKAPKLPGKVNLSQLGSIGLETSSGVVFDSTIKELRGARAFQQFREMADHSAVIGACLFAIEMLIRKVKWRFEPGDASAEEKDRAEILDSMLQDMSCSWEDTIAEILSMLVYGFAYMEIVYKLRGGPEESDSKYHSRYSDNLISWRKWVLMPAETLHQWKFDPEGGIQGFIQRSPTDFKDRVIPIEKSLLFRTKVARNNPQGRSLLLNAFYPWQFVKRIMEVEGIGVERDLAGLPMALVPPEIMDPQASQEDKDFLAGIKDLVTNVRRNAMEGIVFPMAFDSENNPQYEFKLLATGGMRQFDTNKIIERYERRMAMSLLSDFIMMGHERVGSLALSKDKTTLIGRALAGILASISAVINRHAIPRLYQLNGWGVENPAQIVPGDVENADIKNLGVYVRNLVSVGAMTPDPGLEAALREAGGLPKIDPAYILAPGEMPAGQDPNGDQQDQGADEEGDDNVSKSDLDDDDFEDEDDELEIPETPVRRRGPRKNWNHDGPGATFAAAIEAADRRRAKKAPKKKPLKKAA